MAITVYGVEADLDVTQWSLESHAQSASSPNVHGVISGFVASIASGDRRVSVSSSGLAYAPGVRIVSDSQFIVTLPANATSVARLYYVVIEVDWTGTATTAGSVKYVGGGTSVPTLVQTPGVRWQIPLARVQVDPGATSISGNLIRLAPLVDTGAVTLSLPGGWEQQGVPLAVCRANGTVELNGRIKRTGGNVAESSGADLGTVIPETFRPRRQITVPGVTRWGTASAEPVFLSVESNGTATVYPAGATLSAGDVARFHATWLPEV